MVSCVETPTCSCRCSARTLRARQVRFRRTGTTGGPASWWWKFRVRPRADRWFGGGGFRQFGQMASASRTRADNLTPAARSRSRRWDNAMGWLAAATVAHTRVTPTRPTEGRLVRRWQGVCALARDARRAWTRTTSGPAQPLRPTADPAAPARTDSPFVVSYLPIRRRYGRTAGYDTRRTCRAATRRCVCESGLVGAG